MTIDVNQPQFLNDFQIATLVQYQFQCPLGVAHFAMLVFISAFRTRFSYSFVSFNPKQFFQKAFGDVVVGWPLLLTMVHDNQAGWLIKYSATVVVGVAVATLIWRHAWKRKRDCHRTHDSHDVRTTEEASTSEDSVLKCSCGLPAKLRISRTFRNPYRLFYNCPKNAFHHQCEYFHWSDEMSANGERSRKEISFLQNECIRLHKKIAYVQSQRQNDRALWERERAELRSKVSSVQAELDDIKRRVQHLYDLDNMPPFDNSCSTNEDDDGATIVETV